MTSLFINTSTKRLVVAITKDDKVLFEYSDTNSNELSSKIMPIIDEAFIKADLKPSDIDTIFVTNGPGSFTGIRIGLTIAKVMAWSLKIKVVPISSLELMASSLDGVKAPLIDARRGYVFAGLYDNDLNQIRPDRYILLDEFLKENKDIKFISHDEFEFEVNDLNYDILKVIKKHKDDAGINPHALNPNYLKLTEAEEKFNESR